MAAEEADGNGGANTGDREAIFAAVNVLDDQLGPPYMYLNLFSLALSGLPEIHLTGKERFTQLFDHLSQHPSFQSNLSLAVAFTCSVLTQFHCPRLDTLREYASVDFNMEVAYPAVDKRLALAEKFYDMTDESQRRSAIQRIADELLNHYATYKITSIAGFVQLLYKRNVNIPTVEEMISHASEQHQQATSVAGPDSRASRDTCKWETPPDNISIPKNNQGITKSTIKKCVCFSSVLIGLPLLILLIFLLVTFINTPKSGSPVTVQVNNTIQFDQHRPFLIKPDPIVGTANIRLTTTSTATVNVFYTQCQGLVPSQDPTLPPIRIRALSPPASRQSYNYFFGRCDFCPINLAPGSSLTYEILASSSSNTSCLSLFLFDSKEENDMFKNDMNARSVANYSCLPVGTPEDPILSNTVFPITKQASYYVVLSTSGDIRFNATISVNLLYYNTSGLSIYTVSSQDPCDIPTCHSLFCSNPPDDICLLAVSDSDTTSLTYQQEIALFVGYRVETFWTGITSLLVGYAISLGLSFLLCYRYRCCCCCCKRSPDAIDETALRQTKADAEAGGTQRDGSPN